MKTIPTKVGEVAVGPVPFEEWERSIAEGELDIEGSGWGEISKVDFKWLSPNSLVQYDVEEEMDNR